jgi:hypothetical protein
MSGPQKAASGVILAAPATRVAIPQERFPGLSPRAYCLTVEGDGLRPRFASGDVLVIDPDRAPVPGDFVVLIGPCHETRWGEWISSTETGIFHVVVGTTNRNERDDVRNTKQQG